MPTIPLAGGLLTGKHTSFDETPQPGRFDQSESYQMRYWKPDYFEVMDSFQSACEQHRITPAQAALRWLGYHSQMQSGCGDGIIVGASKVEHLVQNLAAFGGGKLPDDILSVLDQGWEVVRPDCFRYFRP